MTEDVTVHQTADHVIEVEVEDNEGNLLDDLSGYEVVHYRVGNIAAGGRVLEVTGSESDLGSIVELVENLAYVRLSRNDLRTLQPRSYGHQLVLANPAGKHGMVVDGTLIVKRGL